MIKNLFARGRKKALALTNTFNLFCAHCFNQIYGQWERREEEKKIYGHGKCPPKSAFFFSLCRTARHSLPILSSKCPPIFKSTIISYKGNLFVWRIVPKKFYSKYK